MRVRAQAAARGRIAVTLGDIGDLEGIAVIVVAGMVMQAVVVNARGAMLMHVKRRKGRRIAVQAAGHEDHGNHEKMQSMASQSAHIQRKNPKIRGRSSAPPEPVSHRDVAAR